MHICKGFRKYMCFSAHCIKMFKTDKKINTVLAESPRLAQLNIFNLYKDIWALHADLILLNVAIDVLISNPERNLQNEYGVMLNVHLTSISYLIPHSMWLRKGEIYMHRLKKVKLPEILSLIQSRYYICNNGLYCVEHCVTK